jgi:Zn-dependent peptidase ImmA (M78 family)/DNA-binding XRE family transcriptional regulator
MQAECLAPDVLGERLRLARETASLTQASVAKAVGIARTTLVAIEQGRRRIRIGELQDLARLYKTSANSLLRREATQVDLVPRFRKMFKAKGDSIQTASRILNNLVKAEVELENLLGVPRTVNYPPERPIMPGNVASHAESDAIELRQRLGLGFQPILDITTLLEFELGARVYVRRFDGDISGLFAFSDSVGACILLNANHPRERRNNSAAHELGHLISTRREADVLHTRSPERSPEERYANAFARSFLTPSRTVIGKFHEVTAGAQRFTRRHAIVLAHTLGVSRELMVRRLEELELTKPGTWDWFVENGGITDEQAREVLGDLTPIDREAVEANRPTTLRLSILAAGASQRGLLSEGQLARLLNVNRIELREMIGNVDADEEIGDDAPVLLR